MNFDQFKEFSHSGQDNSCQIFSRLDI